MIWILAIVLCHHALAFWLQRMVLFPGASMPPGNARPPEGAVRLELPGDPEAAHAFLLPPLGGTSPAPLLVYTHGNAEFVEWSFDLVEPYRRAGFHVLLPEYRGFGHANGSPSMDAIVADVIAHIAAAKARPEVDATHVVYHGRSLGGGVLGTVAGLLPPDRLILEASFSSVRSMAGSFTVPPYLVRDNFSPSAALAGPYAGPVLLLHSQDDEVIPFAESDQNLEAARSNGNRPKSMKATRIEASDGMGHNDPWLHRAQADIMGFALRR